MNWLDIIILVPLLVGLVIGLKKGLIIELAGLLSIIVGYICTRVFGAIVTGWLIQQFTWSESICSVLAHTLLFLVVSILINLLAKLLTKLFKSIRIGWLNRLLGGLFGLLKWGAVVLFLVFCLQHLDGQFHFLKEEVKSNSVVYTQVAPISEKAWNQVKDRTNKFIEAQKNEQNQ